MNKAIFLALIVALLTLSTTAHAEEFLCAAVLPCADDGSVLKEFQGGACELTYRAQCASVSNKSLQTNLAACIDDAAESAARQSEMEKQLRSVKAKLRAAHRALRR